MKEYIVKPTDYFNKKMKYYQRKKKYKNIYDDINNIVVEIRQGNFEGGEIKNLKLTIDKKVFKVRIANTSVNIGKSGGFRMLYLVLEKEKEIKLLTLYSKKDRETISEKEII